jgi:hypothetical protein
MITNEANRYNHLYYPNEVRNNINQYLNADFKLLSNDKYVNFIYKNDEFEMWTIGY